MKNIAELKRTLFIGKKIKLVFSKFQPHRFLNMEREVNKVQTNGVYFKNPEKPESNGSWLEFPKSSQFEGTDNGWIIKENGEKILEYILI